MLRSRCFLVSPKTFIVHKPGYTADEGFWSRLLSGQWIRAWRIGTVKRVTFSFAGRKPRRYRSSWTRCSRRHRTWATNQGRKPRNAQSAWRSFCSTIHHQGIPAWDPEEGHESGGKESTDVVKKENGDDESMDSSRLKQATRPTLKAIENRLQTDSEKLERMWKKAAQAISKLQSTLDSTEAIRDIRTTFTIQRMSVCMDFVSFFHNGRKDENPQITCPSGDKRSNWSENWSSART